MNILIVDDEVLLRDVIGKMVSGWGHCVSLAGTGKEALEKATASRFDVLILDVFLPDMTAVELIPLVKGLQANAWIITVTGQSSRQLEGRLRELGISYYMAKPFQREELHSILSHMAERTHHVTEFSQRISQCMH